MEVTREEVRRIEYVLVLGSAEADALIVQLGYLLSNCKDDAPHRYVSELVTKLRDAQPESEIGRPYHTGGFIGRV